MSKIDQRFYMTYAHSRAKDIIPLAEKHDIGLMTNAAHRYSDATGEFKKLWDYKCPHIVDSGGYNVQVNYNRYPWSVEQYHEWLSQYTDRIQWAAVMDYACEERFDSQWTGDSVEQRKAKTVANTVKHFDLDPDYNVLPVLQGRSVRDYVESYDMLRDRGIPVKDVGLGTVCRISSSEAIVETEKKVRNRCSDIENIHGFGVKIDAYKRGASFESADSQAWVYAASNGKCYLQNGNGLTSVPMSDNSRKRTVWSFANYYDYVSSLSDNFPDSTIDTVLCNLENSQESSRTSTTQEDDIEVINKALGLGDIDMKLNKPLLQKWAIELAKQADQ